MKYEKVDRDLLVRYLKMKVDQEDWHGVADAANDLREFDAYWEWKENAKVSG